MLGPKGALYAEVGQGIDARYGAQVHAAAQPAVSPIGTPQGHELFAAKAGAAPAAIAGLHLQPGLIDEFHKSSSLKQKPRHSPGFEDIQGTRGFKPIRSPAE